MADVSVIIPVYNAEKTLRKCVESIVFGAYRNVEVILVEDRSADESWTLCQKLAQQFDNVRVLRNDRNRGVSYTRNRGLEAATGEYICFVDSDDWVSGSYVWELLHAATEHSDKLVLCGFHFINMLENCRRVFLWESHSKRCAVERDCLFDLHENTLLGQLWNKIFRKSTICKYNLCFDEELLIGEDFKFVLDYLSAASIRTCIVLNYPLYYYTRMTGSSLMCYFGHRQREQEFNRYKEILTLTGNTPRAQAQYGHAIRVAKQNFVYQCLRDSRISKAEQLSLIRNITGDNQSGVYYEQLQKVRFKEALVLTQRKIRYKMAFFRGELVRKREQRIIQKARSVLRELGAPVTILSQNCIGGVFYKDMGLQFTSPTVGLFFQGNDFVRFVLNLEEYIAKDIHMRWGEEYPIGALGDIEIHFKHYNTCKEAEEAWKRRCRRINWHNIVVLCTDRDEFDNETYIKWATIPYRKILFTASNQYRADPNSLYFREFRSDRCVGDIILRRKFYKNSFLINMINAKVDRRAIG